MKTPRKDPRGLDAFHPVRLLQYPWMSADIELTSRYTCMQQVYSAHAVFFIEKGLSLSSVGEGERLGRRVFGVGFWARAQKFPAGFGNHTCQELDMLVNFLSEGLQHSHSLTHTTHTPTTPTATLLPCWPWSTCHNDAIILDTPYAPFP
jgi:hypothetical protein